MKQALSGIVLLISVSVVLSSCREEKKPTLFTLEDHTHVDFRNDLKETRESNVFNYRNFYNGGGVAIGDINNDGLPDIFFTGNQADNKLYLNKGNFKFEDISEKAGFGPKKQWSTGVTFVDINHDGWLDIYICNAGNMLDSNLRRNQLFINNHDLTFTEEAHAYGLDNDGYTTQASFFDYDMDGDLDCFIVNNSPIPVNTLNYANKRDLPADQWEVAPFLKGGGDHLYRNDNGHFTEVTKQTGIHGSLISLGLGVTVGDVNGDGYPDIYVSNDFFERDYLYINQQNGTFKDELEDYVQHTSLASMGADMQDINNDGYPDIFTTDMLPDNDYRLKTTASFDNYDVYHLKEKSGFYHQFMQNTIQLNNQDGKFMEIANYAGVEASDWSWGALMFDADNDGYNDLYVCNGIAHDLTNQDFIDYFANDIVQRMALTGQKGEVDEIINKMPSTPLKNKLFRNEGNLRFKDVGDAWGFTQPSFSNGAAYGDLDNDGDMDLVVSNVNGPAFIYRNQSQEWHRSHYIAFSLKGRGENTYAIGTKIEVYKGNQVLSREEIPSKGFQSSMDYKIIFGLGKDTRIDSVRVIWPNRVLTTFGNLAVDTVHLLGMPDSGRIYTPEERTVRPLFLPQAATFEKHQEDEYIDFNVQRNIPRMLSKEGPGATVGDVNGDGLVDVFICGGPGQPGQLYLQEKSGAFTRKPEPDFDKVKDHEETACLFFDCDHDGDLDLYVGSGGNDDPPRSPHLSHLLFRNDGKGNFTQVANAFPENSSNISVAAACDFDGDGDLDLFVGGRNTSFLYGAVPESYLFVNDGKGHFTDVAAKKYPALAHAGMVTGAAWADMTGGGKKDLVLVGEWMSPRIFSFTGDSITEIKTNLSGKEGWWQTVKLADLDGDGKEDLILGNVGENFYLRPDSAHPVKLWVNYFGMDGTPQEVISRTVNGKDMPVFLKREMEQQFPYLQKENLKHEIYASRTVQQLFGDQLMQQARMREFNFKSSVIAWNQGGGTFALQELPPEVQFSSLNAVEVYDINKDGLPDLVMAGNQFGFQPQFCRLDADYGIVMLNRGNRRFDLLPARTAGLDISGQVRAIVSLDAGSKRRLLFLRNDDYPLLYGLNPEADVYKAMKK